MIQTKILKVRRSFPDTEDKDRLFKCLFFFILASCFACLSACPFVFPPCHVLRTRYDFVVFVFNSNIDPETGYMPCHLSPSVVSLKSVPLSTPTRLIYLLS